MTGNQVEAASSAGSQPSTGKTPIHSISAGAALEALGTDREDGLTEEEAGRRLASAGPNQLDEKPPEPAYRLVGRQFNDLLILLLIGAAGLAFYLDDNRGGSILLAIVGVNALIGAYQEYKAEKILSALKQLVQAKAIVIRDGERREIDEVELVPGDIVVLQEGEAVPADVRLIESREFRTNDFILTGESLPQPRDAELVLEPKTVLTGQDNLAFLGTTVAGGSAVGVVFATGMNTAIGSIAQSSQDIEKDRSPLQREINSLARSLTRLAGVIAIVLFGINVLLRHDEFATTQLLVNHSLLFAIGVAAACVPQGLPAQISVALSLGIRRLARKNAVVKRLSAVEALGSASVICSDKTGTITRNELTIVRGWVDGLPIKVSGTGYDPSGQIEGDETQLPESERPIIADVVRIGVLASNGQAHAPDETHPDWYAIGDPTDAAFTPLAFKAGVAADELHDELPLVAELPFDSDRKRMSMVRRDGDSLVGYMKGATESVLSVCDRIQRNGEVVDLSDTDREDALARAEAYSDESLRVIALAWRDFPSAQKDFPQETTESGFVFAGLVAMADLPRPGVAEAVRIVQAAGIRLFMITGDDASTAEAIAERIGMVQPQVVTSDDLAATSDDALEAVLRNPAVIIARAAPEDKYRVVDALKKMGEVVAVTGDGVNDALSLKKADIGVAMGKLGSEVAKEAAEVILIDDNFATLTTAVKEGRNIFQNLQSVFLSSITSNLGELAIVLIGFAGVAAGLPIPMTAVQILAVDLIAEMLPLMALTFDPPARGIMNHPPRDMKQHIVSRESLAELAFFGLLMGTAGYFSFFMVLQQGGTTGMGQAAAYVTIALVQFMNILSRRSTESIASRHLLANRFLWGALLLSTGLITLIVSAPAIGIWFGFEPLRLEDWAWPIAGASAFLLAWELKKRLFRSRQLAGTA